MLRGPLSTQTCLLRRHVRNLDGIKTIMEATMIEMAKKKEKQKLTATMPPWMIETTRTISETLKSRADKMLQKDIQIEGTKCKCNRSL